MPNKCISERTKMPGALTRAANFTDTNEIQVTTGVNDVFSSIKINAVIMVAITITFGHF